MKLKFHPAARLEYREAAEYYSRARSGLGAEFTREIEHVLEQIIDTPDQWRVFELEVRRCQTRRFPYAVLYKVEPGYLLVIAVMHTRREPGYWHQRVHANG